MIYRNHFLTIDLQRANVTEKIYVRQAEIGNKLHVTLTQGMTPLALPESTEGLCMFVYTKPAGTKSDTLMSVEDNVASAVIPRAAVDAVGEVKCEVRVYDSVAGTWLTSPTFVIEVQAVQYDAAAQQEIVSDPTVYETIAGTEANRVSAEELRVSAEQGRVDAEALRVSAETARENYIDGLKAAVLAGDFDGDQGPQGEQGPQGPKGDPGSSGGGNIYYGTCETAASTQDKVVDVPPDFVKQEGVVLIVTFKNAHTGSTPPKIKIGSNTAESICYDYEGNSVVTATDAVWTAKSAVLLTYRNNHWVLLPGVKAEVNRYGITKLSSSTTSTSETQAATSKAVKTVMDNFDVHATTSNFGTTKLSSSISEAAEDRAATPKGVKDYVDAQIGGTLATGTFTPNFTPGTGSNLTVKQIGGVVYLSGMLVIDGTWSDITSNHLGDITGVDPPASVPFINVLSSADMSAWRPGVISAANGGNDSTYVGMGVTGTDIAILINGFYFT